MTHDNVPMTNAWDWHEENKNINYVCDLPMLDETREPGWCHSLPMVAVGGKGPNVT